MKKILAVLCIFLPVLIQAQEAHVYDTVKATNFDTWIQVNYGNPQDYGTSLGNQIGIGLPGPEEFRTINDWEWAYNDIPTQATVTSVEIKFKASDGRSDNFNFTLHSIGYKLGTTGVNFFNQCNAGDQVDSVSLTVQQYNYNYFDKIYTTGPLRDSVQAAVTSGRYYFTLGIKSTGSDIPGVFTLAGC